MNEQIKKAYVWRCMKCGRVLLTPGGVKRHLEHCKMIPPVLEGQMSIGSIFDEEEKES